MAKKTRKVGRPKQPGPDRVPLHIEVPPAVKQGLERLAERNFRKITAEAIIALQNHLAANGLWPPTEPPAPPTT